MWDIYSRSGVCLRPDTERQVIETIHQRSVSRAAKGRKLEGGDFCSPRTRVWLAISVFHACCFVLKYRLESRQRWGFCPAITVVQTVTFKMVYYGALKTSIRNSGLPAVLTGWKCLLQEIQHHGICVVGFSSILFFLISQFGVSENELGSPEEVHQWSDQQSERFQHCQHYSRAAAGEYCEGQVMTTDFVLYWSMALFLVCCLHRQRLKTSWHNPS